MRVSRGSIFTSPKGEPISYPRGQFWSDNEVHKKDIRKNVIRPPSMLTLNFWHLDGYLYMIADKTVGFGLDSTYHRRQGSMIWMG